MNSFRGYPIRTICVAVGGKTFELAGPANRNELIDDPVVIERFEKDEYMPYWADLWPAASLLAEVVAAWPPAPTPSPRVLELGCGLGLVGLVAWWRGYDVYLTDYDADAVAFVAESARRSGLPPPRTCVVDWRLHDPGWSADVILAADLLYEARNHAPIATFIRTHLRPGGRALVCDANRKIADAFPGIAQAEGLDVHTIPVRRDAIEGTRALEGRLFELRLGDLKKQEG